MGRGKLALEFIAKDRSRRTTFEKRKKGLMKKAEEFSILCGVDTCMIIYNADDSPGRGPTVWPHDPEKARQVIDRYLSEGIDRRRRHAMGLPEFFVSRKRKLDCELAKVRSANWAAKYPVPDELISSLSQDQLRALLAMLGMKLEGAKKRLLAVKESAAWNTLPGVNPMHMEEFKFNGSAIHSHNNDYRQLVPMNVDGSMMEPPTEFPPLVIGSYLPPLMDSGSVVVNNPMMWPLIGNSSSTAGGGSSSSNTASNHQNNNNCYCNYSAVTVPAEYNPHYLSLPTHQSLSGTLYQYNSTLGVGTFSAPENTPFDYSGQGGMLGNASSSMTMMMPPLPPPPPPLPLPTQQQPLMLQYPMTMQDGSVNASMFERCDQQATFHGVDGDSNQVLFTSNVGDNQLEGVRL